MRHVEAKAPGELLNQDTFYRGTLKDVGKGYVHAVVDAFCSLAFAKVYTSKMPTTAADTLHDRVLPAGPSSIPTSYCWLHDIEHRTTKIRSPRTNGFVERMNRTLLDEHFRIKGREKWYESIDEIQRGSRPLPTLLQPQAEPSGLSTKGRTPAEVLREGLGRIVSPSFVWQQSHKPPNAKSARPGNWIWCGCLRSPPLRHL